jgi:photosystem II stability/assembly factor-like uncharacterized protein
LENKGMVVGGGGYNEGNVELMGPAPFSRKDTILPMPVALSAVWALSDSLVVSCGFGWLQRSTDGGRRWTRLPVTGDFFSDLHFPDSLCGYVCGRQGSLYRTLDAGSTWTQLLPPRTFDRVSFESMWFTDRLHGWLVGDFGVCQYTRDGGKHWQQLDGLPANALFTDICCVGKHVWLTSNDGLLYRFYTPE